MKHQERGMSRLGLLNYEVLWFPGDKKGTNLELNFINCKVTNKPLFDFIRKGKFRQR